MKYFRDFIVFFTILLILSIVTFQNMMFPDFDWFNYRFYNCWAFLTDRMTQDFYAANFRTCFNPLIDIPDYFLLLKLNNHPYIFTVISLLDTTCLLFLVYKIAGFFFNRNGFWKQIFSLSYVLVSPVIMLQMTFDQNDVKIAFLCLLAFYLILRNVFQSYSKKRNTMIVLAGVIIGLAVGLKLTACVYAFALLLILLMLYKKIDKPFKTATLFCLGILPAFLLVDGYWLLKCYLVYHNPFFPYFNDIFKSEYADAARVLDKDYSHLRPQNLCEFVFYPFYYSCFDRLYGTDKFSWDPRYAINFISVLIISVLCFLKNKFPKIKNYISEILNFNNLILLALFSIVPYYINLIIFGTDRYVIPSCAVFGIIFYSMILLLSSLSKYKAFFVSICCLISLFFVYKTSEFGVLEYIRIYNNTPNLKYTYVLKNEDLKFEDDSTVILLNAGASIAVVGQNPKAHYIGFAYPEEKLNLDYVAIKNVDLWYNAKRLKSKYLEDKISKLISEDKKIYVLYAATPFARFLFDGLFLMDKNFDRRLIDCSEIELNVLNSYFWGTEITKCEFLKPDVENEN